MRTTRTLLDSTTRREWMPLGAALATSLALVGSSHAQTDADVRQIEEHVTTLAGEFFQGRAPGTDGIDRAAEYVAFHFAQDGLEPLFDGEQDQPGDGFLQLVPLDGAARLDGATASIAGGPELNLGEAFGVLGSSGAGEVSAPLAFVGYSIGRGPDGYRSYSNEDDLAGRIALMLRFEPMTSRGTSVWAEGSARWSRRAGLAGKIEEAVARGAESVILVSPPEADDPRAARLPEFDDTDFGFAFDVPVIALDAEQADALVRRADPEDRSLGELIALANRVRRHEVIAMRGDVEVSLDVRTGREVVATYNVGAILPGRGDLVGEYVIIGAHYDHLGFGRLGGTRERSQGLLHPGADDNASGTAALLLLGERLARAYTDAPADADLRSVVFLAFTAEEIGLIGSRVFVREAPFDLARSVFMLNLDMIGRIDDGRVFLSGMGTARDLDQLFGPILEGSDLRFRVSDSGLGPSDHTNFHRAGMPVLHFFSGSHGDYHTPRDTPDLVNMEGVAQLTKVIERMALELASAEQGPAFAWTGQGEWSPVRLGIAIEEDDPDRPGVIVASVDRGTAAQDAGLRAGDVIVGWDGRTLRQSDELIDTLADHEPGDEVDVTVDRAGAELNLVVRLRSRLE